MAPPPKRIKAEGTKARQARESPIGVYTRFFYENPQVSQMAALLQAQSAGLRAFNENKTPEARLAALRQVMTTVLRDCAHRSRPADAAEVVAAVFAGLPADAQPVGLAEHLGQLAVHLREGGNRLQGICAQVLPDGDAEYIEWLECLADAFRDRPAAKHWLRQNAAIGTAVVSEAQLAGSAYRKYFG